jgi:hypothetical protein
MFVLDLQFIDAKLAEEKDEARYILHKFTITKSFRTLHIFLGFSD